MKRLAHIVSAVTLVGVLMLSPVNMPAGQTFSITAYAHGGHHGNGHHGNSAPDYYYCNGHEAHRHNNGACPYADSEYFYCDGHEAHHHDNGVCPYADSEYFYCDGHEAHHHNNGICPYASSVETPSAPAVSGNADNADDSASGAAPDTASDQTNNVTARRSQKRYISQNISDVICMYDI